MKHFPARFILASRWLMAPLYIGLIASFLLLLVRFFRKLYDLFAHAPTQSTNEVIVGILSLVELSLVGNLLIMVIFSGYENYVARLYGPNTQERPSWMEHVDFSDIKLKLIGSIVAITAIQLLEIFLDIDQESERTMLWRSSSTPPSSPLACCWRSWTGCRWARRTSSRQARNRRRHATSINLETTPVASPLHLAPVTQPSRPNSMRLGPSRPAANRSAVASESPAPRRVAFQP
jgi:uncharacterized protein (TIGR00645 family)